ncbi:MAG: DNA recombination protein RmuC [Gammaproteobacteria bacterium]
MNQESLYFLLIITVLLLIIIPIVYFISKRKNKFIELSFSNLANEILKENNETLNKNNFERLQETLAPFKEQINQLNAQISDLKKEQARAKENFSLQVEKVVEQTTKISVDADNLTNALKSDSKAQGTWGEMVLERTLEESGLRQGIDYELQKSFKDKSGKNYIPDAVIYLPDNRNIIIDSKVSLTAYSKYIDTKDSQEGEAFLKEHIKSIKSHMKGLVEKDYNSLEGINAPDYVLIFVPLESALSSALKADWDIQRLAMQNQMGFVTPINLISILRMAESLWKLDSQNKNAQDIAKRAGLMIDKFNGLNNDIKDLKRYLNLSFSALEGAENKLINGNGNLFSQAKELEQLGAKTKKKLSDN